jgi:hypothetical protein
MFLACRILAVEVDIVRILVLGFLLAASVALVRSNAPPVYGPIFSGATTFNEMHIVDLPLTWTKTGELHFPKYQDGSNMLFTAQITFINDSPEQWGTWFKLRFRTEEGLYISDSPFTGAVNAAATAYQNCMLSDTILDTRVNNHPPKGDYVAEVWAYTGGGTLKIVPYATNITVWEVPFFITPR